MSDAALTCATPKRRQKLFGHASMNGIDFVEVLADQKSLCVHFFGSLPERIKLTNIRIDGGRRVRNIRPVDVRQMRANDDDLDDCLHIELDKAGDFSAYRLCLIERDGKPLKGLDPRYACAEFFFKLDCPSEADCKSTEDCPPEPLETLADINYLAKDYASFRQLIYDRLAVTMPDWRERHAPDLGVTLVEILAYAADHLSYYQDAVATEAYIDTARLRTSIRRHLRLIDYSLHDGNNARALVTVWVSSDLTIEDEFQFVTAFEGIEASNGGVASEVQLAAQPASSFEVFERDLASHPLPIEFRVAHNAIEIYTWGDEECCLAKGATRATLVDERADGEDGMQRALKLRPGDILIFEEAVGPASGSTADADPSHRHAVRLTKTEKAKDELLGRLVLEIEWSAEDALPFPLCLSARRGPPECDRLHNITLARGNVLVVTHGATGTEGLGPVGGDTVLADCACEGSIIESSVAPRKFTPQLSHGPLIFSDPVPRDGPASRILARDVARTAPQISLTEQPGGSIWEPAASLMDSDGEDRRFVAECNEEGLATLRFGDGRSGGMPEAGHIFSASYRIGRAEAGNVGRDLINHIVLKGNTSISGVTVRPRNPLAAVGGIGPQSVDEARAIAPGRLRMHRERAVTADDYAELAARNSKLQGAAAQLRWTGSWREACIAIDPLHSETPPPALLLETEQSLLSRRRMGHDLSVNPARYVPIDLAIIVCVQPHYARADVQRALRRAFSQSHGYFNPDRLIFGEGVRLSSIVTTAQAVEGVQTVQVSKLEQLGFPDKSALEYGILKVGGLQIAQLENSPDLPENGRLTLILRGGR